MQMAPLRLTTAIAAAFALPLQAAAQDNLQTQLTLAQASYQALREIPVMVSVIGDGDIVRQSESALNSSVRFSVPPGVYDVRVEGDGMETLVKRGIRVLEGQVAQVTSGPMRTGTGVRIVEYATGGLSREEVAARLAKLESEVAELNQLKSQVEELKRAQQPR